MSSEDGEEAPAKLAEMPFAMVLMDCHMPGTNGYEATLRIREAERLNGHPRIPILALTANAFKNDVELHLDAWTGAWRRGA